MRKSLLSFIMLLSLWITTRAQNTSPYWSMAGNSSATLSNKIGTTNNVSLRFVTNNTERMKILYSGNVGIGTSSPAFKLHVESAGTAIYGNNNNGSGYGVYGTGQIGLYGYCNTNDGDGVRGYSGSETGYGVFGKSSASIGVFGFSDSYIGVWGYTGSASAYAGFFSGSVYTSGNYVGSDKKLKQNITNMSSGIDVINKLQPKEYEYKQEGNYKLMNLPKGKHYGVIAQDLEQVLPNLVKATSFDTRMAQSGGKEAAADQPYEIIDFKAVNYTELIPVMIRGMQELSKKDDDLQQQLQELRDENKTLKQELTELKALITGKNISGNTADLNVIMLEQNSPNPFKNTTTIRYHIPTDVQKAALLLSDYSGRVIKSIPISSMGNGTLTIDASQLSSGTYNYSIVTEGRTLATKKMIVNK